MSQGPNPKTGTTSQRVWIILIGALALNQKDSGSRKEFEEGRASAANSAWPRAGCLCPQEIITLTFKHQRRELGQSISQDGVRVLQFGLTKKKICGANTVLRLEADKYSLRIVRYHWITATLRHCPYVNCFWVP